MCACLEKKCTHNLTPAVALSLYHFLLLHSCHPYHPTPLTLFCTRERVQWGPWPWWGREAIHCCAKPLAPPLPRRRLNFMNNGREKYILSFNSPGPLAESVQPGPNCHSTGLRLLRPTPPPLPSCPPPSPCHTTTTPPMIVSLKLDAS